MFKILDSKTNSWISIDEKTINIYLCGPTTYNDVHIGNLRPLLVVDLFRRYLKFLGIKSKLVHNFTDIDDKIINIALEKNISEEEVAKTNIAKYNKIIKELNILEINEQPKVTDNIRDIILFISTLLNKKHAYETKNGIYLDVSKDERYGEISKNKLENLISDESKEKKNPFDFALWKYTTKGVKWNPLDYFENAKFKPGRPGWHTECIVFIEKYMKDNLTIHAGGLDLKFPHHENENSQYNLLNSKKNMNLSKIWMHVGLINFNNQKMSKSIGNIILAKDFISNYGVDALKYILLVNDYSQPINISEDTINLALKQLLKYKNVLKKTRNFLIVNKKGMQKKNINLESLKISSNISFNSFLFTKIEETVNELNANITNFNNDESRYLKIKNDFEVLNYILFNLIGLYFKDHKRKLLKTEETLLINYNLSKSKNDFITSDKIQKILIEKNIL